MHTKSRTLSFLIFTDAFFNISSLILVPIFAVYVLSLGGDVRHIGELYAVHALAFGIVGWISARYFLHKRHTIAIGYCLWAIYSATLIFNQSLVAFYLLQVVAGAANAVRYPFLQQSITDHSEGEIAQFYKTVYRFAGDLAGALLALLAAHLAYHKGFEPVFIFMTCLSVIALINGIFYGRTIHKHKHAAKRHPHST